MGFSRKNWDRLSRTCCAPEVYIVYPKYTLGDHLNCLSQIDFTRILSPYVLSYFKRVTCTRESITNMHQKWAFFESVNSALVDFPMDIIERLGNNPPHPSPPHPNLVFFEIFRRRHTRSIAHLLTFVAKNCDRLSRACHALEVYIVYPKIYFRRPLELSITNRLYDHTERGCTFVVTQLLNFELYK